MVNTKCSQTLRQAQGDNRASELNEFIRNL